MSHRQLSDQYGHRWDVEDQGPLRDQERPGGPEPAHQLHFRRDDGTEHVRTAPHSLDQMADVELRALLEEVDPDEVRRGPDIDGNQGGYGDARE